VYNIGIVNKREMYKMDIAVLQDNMIFFTDLLNKLEKKKKKTPGNGFAIMKCKEKIAEINLIFDKINYNSQITYD
tara:strand:- start:414 stop:638 length:225 start_codon:yes stop_codon:yes gene_type:complete